MERVNGNVVVNPSLQGHCHVISLEETRLTLADVKEYADAGVI